MYIEHLKSLYKVYIIRYDFRTKNLNSKKLNVDPNSLFTIFITMVFTIVHMHRSSTKIFHLPHKLNGK